MSSKQETPEEAKLAFWRRENYPLRNAAAAIAILYTGILFVSNFIIPYYSVIFSLLPFLSAAAYFYLWRTRTWFLVGHLMQLACLIGIAGGTVSAILCFRGDETRWVEGILSATSVVPWFSLWVLSCFQTDHSYWYVINAINEQIANLASASIANSGTIVALDKLIQHQQQRIQVYENAIKEIGSVVDDTIKILPTKTRGELAQPIRDRLKAVLEALPKLISSDDTTTSTN